MASPSSESIGVYNILDINVRKRQDLLRMHVSKREILASSWNFTEVITTIFSATAV
jgi:hypothetical protein